MKPNPQEPEPHMRLPQIEKAASPQWGDMRPNTASSRFGAVAIGLALGFAPIPAWAIVTGPQIDSVVVQTLGTHSVPLVGPMGISFDPKSGEVVVASTGAGRIEFFDSLGRPRGSFLHTFRGEDGELRQGNPKHLSADREGRIYVADLASADVYVRDFRGRLLNQIQLPSPDDRLSSGGAGPMAVGPDGRVFVASRSGGRVHVIGPDGRWIETWGTAGADSGQLSAISGLAVNGEGEVIVACIMTTLGVQVFDGHGKYLRGFGVHDIGPGRFSQPTGVTVTSDGRIWVVDSIRGNLQVFERDGALVGVVGGGEGSQGWLYPSALASDGNGQFALAEWGGNRVRLLWVHEDQRNPEEVVEASSVAAPQSP